ncbi:hypothetical protein ABLG96_20240 [Nakamurella sp. A5-74]|uniref:Carboxylesterase family protein n=1 Tax=Nakamurella sp. A5-74 TaxID=3158264 RepID=A0AAU8DND1_9ACTN
MSAPGLDQLPPDDAPPLDANGREQSIRDIVFARPIGYRPLQMDLFLPAPQNRPAPLVVHLYGGGFAMGSHQRDPFGSYLTAVPSLPSGKESGLSGVARG